MAERTATIGECWRKVRDRFRADGLDTPELDARLLAQYALGMDGTGLVTHEDDIMAPGGLMLLNAFADRRLAGEPVARLLGHQQFYGLEFELGTATLVPRPETELLVDLGLGVMLPQRQPHFLDLGTGCGCIAIALLANSPEASAVAVDISAEALATAATNAAANHVENRLDLRQGSWFAPLHAGELFDVIVSNPPYVETEIIDELAPEVRDFDPHVALDGGQDGLSAYRAIAADAGKWLKPGGWVMVETGSEQGLEAGALFANAGFEGIEIKKDLAGLDRVLIAHHVKATEANS